VTAPIRTMSSYHQACAAV